MDLEETGRSSAGPGSVCQHYCAHRAVADHQHHRNSRHCGGLHPYYGRAGRLQCGSGENTQKFPHPGSPFTMKPAVVANNDICSEIFGFHIGKILRCDHWTYMEKIWRRLEMRERWDGIGQMEGTRLHPCMSDWRCQSSSSQRHPRPSQLL